jgi:predicted acylesterase/phospholipase RssA
MNNKIYKIKSISFSGGGYNCVYHLGVIKYIFEHTDDFKDCQYLGASGGSNLGAFIIINENKDNRIQILQNILDEIIELASSNINLVDQVDKYMNIITNCVNENNFKKYIQDKNRCIVSVTKLIYSIIPQNTIVQNYSSYNDYINHIRASSSIPYLIDNKFRTINNNYFIDGGFTNNQPIIDDDTITVACYNYPHYKPDIYPKFLAQYKHIFKPPTKEYLLQMFALGYKDAALFFENYGNCQWIEMKPL